MYLFVPALLLWYDRHHDQVMTWMNLTAILIVWFFIELGLVPNVNIPQKAIVKGDSLSLSIAAASIVAKVTRDRIMKDLEKVYPGYGFAKNKGYGSSEHILKLKQLGPCQIHRYSFAPIRNWISNPGYSRTEDSKE